MTTVILTAVATVFATDFAVAKVVSHINGIHADDLECAVPYV